jgi:hypothetical protein
MDIPAGTTSGSYGPFTESSLNNITR